MLQSSFGLFFFFPHSFYCMNVIPSVIHNWLSFLRNWGIWQLFMRPKMTNEYPQQQQQQEISVIRTDSCVNQHYKPQKCYCQWIFFVCFFFPLNQNHKTKPELHFLCCFNLKLWMRIYPRCPWTKLKWEYHNWAWHRTNFYIISRLIVFLFPF